MTNATAEARREEATKIYQSAFWNALGHGMSEDEADAYATRKMTKPRKIKTFFRA